MLQSLCKQTCLALLDNACVFHLQINFWVSHRGYEGFRGTNISFPTLFYLILGLKKKSIIWVILVVSINIIILYFIKPVILFENSVICYVLYWKHTKKVLSGQA